VIALLAGIAFAFTLPAKKSRRLLSDAGWAGKAFMMGAEIACIAASGGTFAKMLNTAGVQDILISGEGLYQATAGLFVPSVVAVVTKFAYGSTKNSMPKAASIMDPLLAHLRLDDERTLVCIAIGTGSTIGSFVNDDFFWILARLANFDIKNMLLFYTAGTIFTGGVGTILVFLTGLNVVVGGGIILATIALTVVLVIRRERAEVGGEVNKFLEEEGGEGEEGERSGKGRTTTESNSLMFDSEEESEDG